eukprot:108086_1
MADDQQLETDSITNNTIANEKKQSTKQGETLDATNPTNVANTEMDVAFEFLNDLETEKSIEDNNLGAMVSNDQKLETDPITNNAIASVNTIANENEEKEEQKYDDNKQEEEEEEYGIKSVYEKEQDSVRLVLLPFEDFNGFIDGADIDDNDTNKFIIDVYNNYSTTFAKDTAISVEKHKKLKQFTEEIHKYDQIESQEILDHIYLYNLMYHKYGQDIENIKVSNIYHNYYFEPENNPLVMQVFIFCIQILFTV